MGALLLLPLLVAAGWMVCAGVATRLLGAAGPAFLHRRGASLQLALSLVLLGGFTAAGGAPILAGRDGLRDPLRISSAAGGRWLVLAAAAGAGCFAAEVALGTGLRRLTRRIPALRHPAVEGGTASLVTGTPSGRAGFAAVAAALAVVEELLWRGLLVGYLVTAHDMAPGGAVVISAALFGLQHAWFGVRNVVAKAVDGLVWGAVLVATGNVWFPVISHLVFQALAGRRLLAQRASYHRLRAAHVGSA